MNAVAVVLPGDIDDPVRPSGGNRYDRRLCGGLRAAGWTVHEYAVAGDWPQPDRASSTALARVLASLADRSVVLIDGLIASTVPELLRSQCCRLRLVVLVHMPLGHRPPRAHGDAVAVREQAALSAAAAIITPSDWAKAWLLERYRLPAQRIQVVEPGVEPAEPAPGSTAGSRLLCVAAVTRAKGYEVLLAALAAIGELRWQCQCVGALDLDPPFAEQLRQQAIEYGLDHRVRFRGVCTGAALDTQYAAADLLVLASGAETYAMVVTESLARGIPVVATAVGGIPEALGTGAAGRPGVLVAPGDPAALAGALRAWLDDPELRHRLRQAARQRRVTLTDWSDSCRRAAEVLTRVAR